MSRTSRRLLSGSFSRSRFRRQHNALQPRGFNLEANMSGILTLGQKIYASSLENNWLKLTEKLKLNIS